MSEGKTPQTLAEWPTAERSAIEWDEAAERVMARIESGESPRSLARVSDEDLFAPPLPVSPNEVQDSAAPETLRSREAAAALDEPRGAGARRDNSVETGREGPMSNTPSSRERDRATLKDLAKLASLVPPASSPAASGSIAPSARDASTGAPPAAAEREENSGVIHLAALAASEGQAAASPSVAPQAAVDATAGRASAPAPAPIAAAPSTPAAAAAIASATPASAPSSRTSTRWIALGGIVAAAAVAAAVFVGMHRQPAAAPVAMNAAATVPSPATPAQAVANATVEPSPIPAADRGVDPSTLPEAVHGAGARTTPSAPAAVAQGAPRAAAPREPQPVAAAAQPATPPAASAAPPAPPPAATAAATASDQSLQALMQQAAGVTPSTTPAAPAAAPATPQAAPGSVPLKPSLGAIEGALGTALPGARACLGPDDPISHAMVTFRSDGSVASVSVSGHAAGKPAEACIRSALMKARVAPFAEAQFSAPVTVRPN